MLRVSHLSLVSLPLQTLAAVYFKERDQRFLMALLSAFKTFCYIMILLHYLGCLWIFVGSEYFIGFEKDAIPWTLDNDDFKDMTHLQLVIYATYWVCTVVTTVGYGDYTGGTTLEYAFSFAIEFCGFVIFAVLQVAVI